MEPESSSASHAREGISRALASLNIETYGKRIDILRELVARLVRIAGLFNRSPR